MKFTAAAIVLGLAATVAAQSSTYEVASPISTYSVEHHKHHPTTEVSASSPTPESTYTLEHHKHHHTTAAGNGTAPSGTCSSGAGVYPTGVSPSITPFKGDAAAVVGSMGGVMAGVLAVLAAL